MDYLFKCVEAQLAPFGTLHYYAYRKLDDDTKTVLYALDQLKSKWIEASELYRDAVPAKQKLLWWQQELMSGKTNRNRMPLLNTILHRCDPNMASQSLLHDCKIAIETLTDGRKTNLMTHFKQNYLGIESLKASVLGDADRSAIEALNTVNEITRHILLINRHYSRNIILDHRVSPQMAVEVYRDIVKAWLESAFCHGKMALKDKHLPNALVNIAKIQSMACRTCYRKIKNPFTETITLSPLRLLFASLGSTKF